LNIVVLIALASVSEMFSMQLCGGLCWLLLFSLPFELFHFSVTTIKGTYMFVGLKD
jgi:hypothetical protein